MVFPLLEFLSMKEIYNDNDLLEGKLQLLYNTNMVDYAREVYTKIHGEDDGGPDDLLEKRSQVVAQLKRYQEETAPILEIFLQQDVQKQFETARDFRQLQDFLTENYNFKPEMIDTLYNFAKFQYECGNYAGAAEYLSFYRILVPSTDRNYLNGLWGKLASEILMQHWDTALEDLNRLKEYIENQMGSFGSALEALQQRAWLLHWSLFVFFNHSKGKDLIIDMFLYQTPYLNTIQTMCPHLLRYLATAVIINKQHRRAVMKDLIKVIQQESYTYKDPITEFLEDLCVNFDFDRAQQKLRDCQELILSDFFLTACLEDFMENARLMIFETFCRIHQCISISMLAQKLSMTEDEAERWIVNLIRHARLDAKIDSSKGHVVMGTQAVSPYSQLIEKTKALSMRSQMLALQIEKRITTSKAAEESQWGNQDF
jgi:translation initiation factor 3 subunit E